MALGENGLIVFLGDRHSEAGRGGTARYFEVVVFLAVSSVVEKLLAEHRETYVADIV